MKKNYFVLLVLISYLWACSKDQNLDDYKQTRLNQNLAKLQAIQGRYSGYLKSKRDDSSLGALQLTLKATTQVQGSTDESRATAQPILLVNVEFQGVSHVAIVANNSYFDPDSGRFQANIPVQQQNAQGQAHTETISITAVVSAGTITGTLEATGYSDYGGMFVLSRNGKDLDTLAKESKFNPDSVFTQKNYIGKINFSGGAQKSVVMILLKAPTTSEVDFLNLLIPERLIQINLNFGNDAHIIFNNGNWDQRTGALTGQTTLTRTITTNNNTTTQTVTLYLYKCDLSQDSKAVDCAISTSNAQAPVAHMNLLLSSNANQEPPPDSSSTRDAVVRVYQGQGQLSPGGSWTPVKMTVVDPAKTRMDEITDLFFPPSEEVLQVSISFPGAQVGLNFPTTKWDIAKGTLDGTQTMIVDNQSNNLSLSCQNFYFSDKKYSFTCTYLSSLRGTYVQFKFSSK